MCETDRQTDRQTDKQRNRHRDRQIDRDRDRQTDRQRLLDFSVFFFSFWHGVTLFIVKIVN